MAQATKQNICKEWPQAVRDLAGAWADFPLAEDIRRGLGKDNNVGWDSHFP